MAAAPRPPRARRAIGAGTAAVLLLAGCGAWSDAGTGAQGSQPGEDVALEHVHGLGVDPADGALYAGTHHGLVRISTDGELVRVADRVQDYMGFTVVGPGRYLASGHPGPEDSGPGNLGLIETTDGGQTWETLSLEGQADFHALDGAGDMIYGYSGGRLLVSEDGSEWADRGAIPIADLAVDPSKPERLLATTEQGLVLSEDRGASFRPVPGSPVLLLADLSEHVAVGISPEGPVYASTDDGLTWEQRGDVGGTPEALVADAETIYAAVGGAIVASTDGGATFTEWYRGD